MNSSENNFIDLFAHIILSASPQMCSCVDIGTSDAPTIGVTTLGIAWLGVAMLVVIRRNISCIATGSSGFGMAWLLERLGESWHWESWIVFVGFLVYSYVIASLEVASKRYASQRMTP
jgi:hypothetical protein